MQLRALANPVETEFPGVRRTRPDVLAGVCNGDRPFGIVWSNKAVWLVDLHIRIKGDAEGFFKDLLYLFNIF